MFIFHQLKWYMNKNKIGSVNLTAPYGNYTEWSTTYANFELRKSRSSNSKLHGQPWWRFNLVKACGSSSVNLSLLFLIFLLVLLFWFSPSHLFLQMLPSVLTRKQNSQKKIFVSTSLTFHLFIYKVAVESESLYITQDSNHFLVSKNRSRCQ